MEVFIALISYSLLLIFGVVLSVDFAGVEKTKRNKRVTTILTCTLLVTQVVSRYTIGFENTTKVYPLISHLPIALTIMFYFKRGWLTAMVSVCSAYLCCQTPRWFGMLAVAIWDTRLSGLIVDALCILPALFLLERYVVPPAARLISQNKKMLLLFGVIPVLFYAFDYFATVYTTVLYDGIKIAVEFMPSTVSLFYFAFIILYDNERQQRSKAETEAILMRYQAEEAKHQITMLYTSQEQAASYRHDLRHHLSLLGSFADSGDMERIKSYITMAHGELDAITPKNFCINQTVNLILSAFDNKAKEKGISLSVNAQLPKKLSIPDTELCAVLSNGLENALRATLQIEDSTRRVIRVTCSLHRYNLLIMMENPYVGEICMENDIPTNQQEGHGFGCRSMVAIAEKRNGHCIFKTKQNTFILQVVIPLEKVKA